MAYAAAKRVTIHKEKLVCHRTNNSSSLEYSRGASWKCAYEMLDRLKAELLGRGLYHELEQTYLNLAAVRIVLYVFKATVQDPTLFSEAFSYYRKAGREGFDFLSHPADYYCNEDIYNVLVRLEKQNEYQFLCSWIADEERFSEGKEKVIDWLNEEIRNRDQLIRDLNGAVDWMERAKRWLLPVDGLKKDSRVVVYGYGDVGKDYCDQIAGSERLKLAGIIDKNWRELKKKGVNALPAKHIAELEFDVILIAVVDRNTAGRIRHSLMALGVPESRIIWFDPRERMHTD